MTYQDYVYPSPNFYSGETVVVLRREELDPADRLRLAQHTGDWFGIQRQELVIFGGTAYRTATHFTDVVRDPQLLRFKTFQQLIKGFSDDSDPIKMVEKIDKLFQSWRNQDHSGFNLSSTNCP